MLDSLYHIVWGVPLLLLISIAGVYYTFALRAIQVRYLPYALKVAISPNKNFSGLGDISHFQSLMTALAATIGIGNIAGVATALTVGGWGAIFWMWVTAILGMAVKYAEAFLAVKFRKMDRNGEMSGGPMYFIERGLGWRWLAFLFALFGALSAFGGGNMLQANSIGDALFELFHIDRWIVALLLTSIIGLTLIGGIQSIGKVAGVIVPFMGVFYLGGCLTVILLNITKLPMVFGVIFENAFTGQAALGGFAGSTLALALQVGVSRGVMTSETGLGTASIAAAAAKTDLPGRQALVSMTGSFLATIITCSMTAFVLGVTEVFGALDISGKLVTGVPLTMQAFESQFGFGPAIVTGAVIFFGFTTLIGWAYYGEKCIEYLLGEWSIPYYRILFTLVVIPGTLLDLEVVWRFADVFNGLMAFPNLIGLLALSPLVIRETKEFLLLVKQEEIPKH